MPIGNWYLDTADFTETITDERAGRRLARSRARAPSAGSRSSYTRSIPTCYPRGTRSATSAPGAAPSIGSSTTRSAHRFLNDRPVGA